MDGSDFSGFIYATVAQLVERCPEEAGVPGSTPGGGTITLRRRSSVGIERWTVNPVVAGSSPVASAINQIEGKEVEAPQILQTFKNGDVAQSVRAFES